MQNEKLKKDNDQLQEQNVSILAKLTQKEYEEKRLTQMIEDLCKKLPKCNIQLETPLLQKVKIIGARAKDLEETIEWMDAEHKARIAELEAKALGTPSEEREERSQALWAFSTTIAQRLEDAHKLLDETTSAWTTINDIEDLVNVREAIQKTQQEMDTIVVGMKDLIAIQHMIKMGETKKLQTQMQTLCKDEARYLKTVQPWQEEVSQISIQVNDKLKEIKARQMTAVSLLEQPATAELVETTKECVEQLEKDLAELQENFMSFTKKITDIHESQKQSRKKIASDSGTSHS